MSCFNKSNVDFSLDDRDSWFSSLAISLFIASNDSDFSSWVIGLPLTNLLMKGWIFESTSEFFIKAPRYSLTSASNLSTNLDTSNSGSPPFNILLIVLSSSFIASLAELASVGLKLPWKASFNLFNSIRFNNSFLAVSVIFVSPTRLSSVLKLFFNLFITSSATELSWAAFFIALYILLLSLAS